MATARRSFAVRRREIGFASERSDQPKIHIPTPLRPFTDKLDVVEVEGTTVAELLQNLTTKFGGLKQHLFNNEGKMRSFVNVYVNDEDIRYLQKEQTPLKAGDTVSIIPSVAGGIGATTAAPTLPQLSGDEVRRYSRHLILPEVGMDGQRDAEGGDACCASAPAASALPPRCIWPPPASAPSASSTSMSSTPATCSGNCCTARLMSAGRSSPRPRIG